MKTKVCNKCKEELTLDKFYKNKALECGVTYTCKKCTAEYYQNNKENILQRHHKNKEKISIWHKQYRVKNKTIIDIYKRENKDKIAMHGKTYREKNKKNISEKSKKYYIENKEIITLRSKKYNKANPQNNIIKKQRRKSRKKRLPTTLTLQQWDDIKKQFNDKCCYCGKESKLEQEHFISLKNLGEYTINNILPACKSCNSSKGPKDFFEWYPKYKNYSKKRERVILKYLGYKEQIQQLKIN